MLNKENLYYKENEDWAAEFQNGYLFLANKKTNDDCIICLRNFCGQSITLGQFNRACKSHSFYKACQTFWKLRANKDEDEQ